MWLHCQRNKDLITRNENSQGNSLAVFLITRSGAGDCWVALPISNTNLPLVEAYSLIKEIAVKGKAGL